MLVASHEHGLFNSQHTAVSPEIFAADTLNLLSLNIAHGRGEALNQLLVTESRHRRNLDQIAALVVDSGAHVVALQEADGPSLWSGGFDHVQYLSASTGYASFMHGYHARSWLFAYGAALLSRVPLADTGSMQFQPTWPTATKGFVRGDFKWRDSNSPGHIRSVTIVSVHLDFSRKAVRREQVAQLVEVLAGITNPLIVMGDFNADWTSVDSPVRVLAREVGLHAYDPTAANLATYKASERLDWVLISDELVFVDYTVLPDSVSDHLAVVTRVGWQAGD